MDRKKHLINKLITEARTYLGSPWKHQGRNKKGVDCVGFLLLSFRYIDIHINEIKGYSRTPDGIALKKIMDEQPNLHKVDTIEVGDILLFRIRRHPQHVALVTESATADFGMIHAYNGGAREVVEHDLADYWKQKIVAIYRLK